MTREIVLVTGGGGYIGASVVHAFMRHPARYIVRLALRRESQKTAYLEKYVDESDRLQFWFFSDMTKEGCFDSALEGVTYVAHLASSTNFEPENNLKDVMEPGIMGMKNMLNAAMMHESVKGIVYTSGISAYYDCHDQGSPEEHFDATSFNPRTWEETAALSKARGVEVYANTKVLVERMAWDFMKKSTPHFWLATVGPMWVLGPSEVPLAKDPVDVGSAYELTYRHVLDTQQTQTEDLPVKYFVDVRDVAEAHVICATDPRAANKRYILSGGRYNYFKISEILSREFPTQHHRICQYPERTYEPTWTVDTSDFEADFDFKWRDLDTCVRDWGHQVLKMPKPNRPGRSDYTAQLDDRVFK